MLMSVLKEQHSVPVVLLVATPWVHLNVTAIMAMEKCLTCVKVILIHVPYTFHSTSLSSDIDECSESMPCDQNAVCLNAEGSFTCMCMTGYSGNGTYCAGTYN